MCKKFRHLGEVEASYVWEKKNISDLAKYVKDLSLLTVVDAVHTHTHTRNIDNKCLSSAHQFNKQI